MRLLKKYATLIGLWYWVFHVCGLKDVLLNFSIQYMPMVKRETNFAIWFLAFMGGEVGLCWAVVISLHYLRKDDALIVLTALALGNTLNAVMKTYWHEPRPFFLSETIIPAKCTNFEYGMPSGHTMGFMTVFRTLSRLIEERGQLPII